MWRASARSRFKLDAHRRQWEALRRSLDEAEAEADRDGWLDAADVFDEVHARLEARANDEEGVLERSKTA